MPQLAHLTWEPLLRLSQAINMHNNPGAIPISRLHRFIHRTFARRPIARGTSFDWNKGYDVRDVIGPIKIKDQGENSSCGGQAASYALEIVRRLKGINEGQVSAKSFYAPIAYTGGGTTVSALMTQFSTHGANLEASIPSVDAYGNPLSEIMMEDKSWMTDATIKDAITRAGFTPYDIGEDMEAVAETIRDYGFVIWEIQGQNGNIPDWRSPYPQPPSKNNSNPIWNHFMCAIGAKIINGKKYIIALQSEGMGWGDAGIQYFDENYFNSGHIIDCFSFVYDTQTVPALFDPFGIWQALKMFFLLSWKSIQG